MATPVESPRLGKRGGKGRQSGRGQSKKCSSCSQTGHIVHGIASRLSQNRTSLDNKTKKGFRVIAPSVGSMAMLAGRVVRRRT